MKKGSAAGAVILVLLLLAVTGLIVLRTGGETADGWSAPNMLEQLGLKRPEPTEALSALSVPEPAVPPITEAGQRILQAWENVRGIVLDGDCVVEGDQASQQLVLYTLDTEKLREDLTQAMNVRLQQWVDGAARGSDVYNEDHIVREDLLTTAFSEELSALLDRSAYMAQRNLPLHLAYTGGAWVPDAHNIEQMNALLGMYDPDALASDLQAEVREALPYIPICYTIDENALSGPAPDPAGFGETVDPAVIERLLQRPEAQALINGQEMVWNAQIERFPNSTIRYYLDETILVLVWQEVEARGVGTFSEVFIADGSQLRRKIAGDTPFDYGFETASSFAQDTNAVLAVGGDFYHHGRSCGISMYQRQIVRFEPDTCDVCYITSDGDMLFSYRGQFRTEDEARRFAEENDVLFSLVFGPVLIDNGQDVTPENYPWGEINDTYARSALGLLGRHHYLTMNINCGEGQYYYLATLRQAADAMIRRGCVKAYTLDGGQTATTVFNGQLINPVQFGWEKEISDVIYFATALPNE